MHVPFVLYALLRHRSLRATITTLRRQRTANHFLESVRTFCASLAMLNVLSSWFGIHGIFRKESRDVIRRNVLIFNYLCRASQELNGVFSVPVLILLTSKFISVVALAFAYIYNKFIHYDDMLENYSMVFALTFFVHWIQILVLLTAADMPANQVVTHISA